MGFLDKALAFIKGKKPDENQVDYTEKNTEEESVSEESLDTPVEPEAPAEEVVEPAPEQESIVAEEGPVLEEPKKEIEPEPEAVPASSAPEPAPEPSVPESMPEKEIAPDSTEGVEEVPATSVEELENRMGGPAPDIKAAQGGPENTDKPQTP